MGARGPQPKPSYLRLLEHVNDGKTFNPAEAKVPPAKELDPPVWFSADKKALFTSICKDLASMGGLSSVDYQMLVLYADTVYEAKRLILRMQQLPDSVMMNHKPVLNPDGTQAKNPDGTPMVQTSMMKSVPWYSQLVNQKRLALLFATHFGMTPSARARIVFLGNGGNDPNPDPFDV